jgi:ribosomal protein L24E
MRITRIRTTSRQYGVRYIGRGQMAVIDQDGKVVETCANKEDAFHRMGVLNYEYWTKVYGHEFAKGWLRPKLSELPWRTVA